MDVRMKVLAELLEGVPSWVVAVLTRLLLDARNPAWSVEVLVKQQIVERVEFVLQFRMDFRMSQMIALSCLVSMVSAV
jgi:hypothetical protein